MGGKRKNLNKINRVILCIIDCLRAEYLFKFINSGLLPNLKRLKDEGIFSKNCITDFPSVTLPTQPTIITGTYTGDYRKECCHGIPAFNWMGRDVAPPILRSYGSNVIHAFKMNEDLGKNCKTLLEMVGDGNKTSITQFCNRGTSYFFPKSKIRIGFYYLLLKYYPNLKKAIARFNSKVIHLLLDNFKNPKKYFRNKEPPIGSLIYFLSSDLLMHVFGYDSRLYKLNLMHIDKVVGVLLDGLEELGYLDQTAIAITSDHGNYRANKVGDLNSIYLKNGLKPYEPRASYKGNFNLAEFGGVGFFYFRGRNNLLQENKYQWTLPILKELKNFGPKRVNLLNKLFNIEHSQLMYYKDDNNTHRKGIVYLKRKDKKTGKIYTGKIEYKGTNIDYKTKYISEDDDNDIFGYLKDKTASKLLDGKFHSNREWMDATYHLDFPMYPDLIPRHFKNPRSGDIILSTDGSVIFNIAHGKRKSDNIHFHDLGLRDCAIVPLLIGGSSDIPHKEIPYCATTDIVPTLLQMLGRKAHPSMVGNSLI